MAIFFKIFGKRTDYIEARARTADWGWRTDDAVRYLFRLSVFVAWIPLSPLIFFASFYTRAGRYFPKYSANAERKRGLNQSKSNEKGMAMEDGRHGTLYLEMAGFYCGSGDI